MSGTESNAQKASPSVAVGVKTDSWFNALPRDKSDTLLLLFACIMVLLPHIEHLPAWTSFTCAMIVFWRGAITWSGSRLPPLGLLLFVATLTMLGVYATAHTLLGREAGVTMLVLLLTLKLLEMRARRDVFVVLFLSFFLILTTFFYSQSIATAIMIVATLIVLLTAQLSFQFSGAIPPIGQRLRMGAFILALAIPLTVVLFVLFPRIQGPLWGMPGDTFSGRSGMSDSMAPGTISQLALSDDIAFRIKFIDPAPASALRYWRGAVLTNFDGRTWTRQGTATSFANSNNASMVENTSAPSGTNIRQQITMEASGQRWLFALETPQIAPILTTNPASRSHINSDGEVLSDRPISDRIRYDITSTIGLRKPTIEAASVLQQALNLPAGFNPQTVAFAAKLRSEAVTDSNIVNAVLSLFHNENFSYTLQPPLLGKNGVDDFLFSTRAGFCEHYAGAFVVLMRAAHIPARVVTGYQGGEINPVDNFMTVRQSDAHAWAEVWLPGRGWVRVDPTAAVAPERIQRSLNQVLPRSFFGGLINIGVAQNNWWNKLSVVRQNWDAISNSWNQWVLNYTPERQKSLLQSFGIDQLDWRMMVGLMFGIGALVVALVTLPLLLVRNKIAPLDKVYSAFCKRMAKLNMTRQLHEGATAYRQRLCATESPLTPQAKNAAAMFLQSYETFRYSANDGPDTVSLTSLKSQLKKLKPLLSQCR
ncbi:DUF3488 and transglutaminase-like domain-containing protein [Glaciimonas sp. PCH181]|uniref:transglutaminase family protein n=1 Tax=Glaciimonas sp. PCH181 TaxID=2133943 RepID=UPI000D3BF3FA|nr:DUF3488 and transglutaminase-like domain-containing protein [Glaciimonas sp. PCH181]PUA17223.1 DUF3488 domain-containing protein [Glaciimonas sp. PCH181]